jgi:tRNA(adenine34) deaminase
MSDPDSRQTDERFMRVALQEAAMAAEEGDVPVGAVIIWQGQIIARGRNQRELLNDPTAHAEILAITAAAEFRESWRLTDCTLYVTLEPCLMCTGAMVNGRIRRVVYGADDPKAGACKSLYQVLSDQRLNHQAECVGGVLADEAADLLQQFFKAQRDMGKK